MFDIAQLAPYFDLVRNEYTGSGGAIQILKPNTSRAVAYLQGSPGGAYFFDWTPNASPQHYALVTQQSASYCLYWARDGVLVTLGLWWYPNGAGEPMTVVEAIWTPNMGGP